MKTAFRFFLSLAAVVVLAGLSACAPKDETAVVGAPTSKSAPAAASDFPILGTAPAWRLPDLDGKLVSSADFKGKVVVVDFWATWCPPCRVEIPGYIELQKKYGKDGLVVVGISLDQGGVAGVKKFVESQGINYPIVLDDGEVASSFGDISAIPTTFLIDREGRIRDRKEGLEDAAVYEKKVLAILK